MIKQEKNTEKCDKSTSQVHPDTDPITIVRIDVEGNSPIRFAMDSVLTVSLTFNTEQSGSILPVNITFNDPSKTNKESSRPDINIERTGSDSIWSGGEPRSGGEKIYIYDFSVQNDKTGPIERPGTNIDCWVKWRQGGETWNYNSININRVPKPPRD